MTRGNYARVKQCSGLAVAWPSHDIRLAEQEDGGVGGGAEGREFFARQRRFISRARSPPRNLHAVLCLGPRASQEVYALHARANVTFEN